MRLYAGSMNEVTHKSQLVFAFGQRTDGHAGMRDVLGGKGANLAEMSRIGLPVPPGFTIGAQACNHYHAHDGELPGGLLEEVEAALAEVEEQQGRGFGDAGNPLLLSVRSGARESMPGMMDTILNLGLNDTTVEALAEGTGDARFAWDCYRRFLQMYGGVVLGVGAPSAHLPDPFEEALAAARRKANKQSDGELDAQVLMGVAAQFRQLIETRTGEAFPEDARTQLWGAIRAVFRSWMNERAVLYRQRYRIPRDWGTAVTVQAMVFGNLDDASATGVAFTRDPATGEKTLYGEYLVRAQGEDVVSGARTPRPIAEMANEVPAIHRELDEVRQTLEQRFHDMQDFEFTVESGRLYVLQTRNGKRTGPAAVRIGVEMHDEGLVDRATALLKIPADAMDALLVPVFDPDALGNATQIAAGLPAGPGAASGHVVFTSDEAQRQARAGNRVILCRVETSPEDLRGMLHADGIVTTRGGVSSHAALVARQLGKVCVCGAAAVRIDYAERALAVGDVVVEEGDVISVDGSTGAIYAGAIASTDSEVRRVLSGRREAAGSAAYARYRTVMDWADECRRLRVRTNADTPQMARQAIEYGAEGIGLCRTEHMFFGGERIDTMRQMILAADETQRRDALAGLLPFQRQDFTALFRTMAGRPVTIRLLDPPLHEFLPADERIRHALAEKLGLSIDYIAERTRALTEENPMLGCRGCRLGILYPEITEMQARAIFEAAIAASSGADAVVVAPEIMVPLVGFAEELADQTAIVRRVAKEVMTDAGRTIDYSVGTMIEVPRAAITADEIARVAEFFSFGTNDLTQMTLGLSRDDMGQFFDAYVEKEIYAGNPFASLDEAGVGRLVTEAVRLGTGARPDLKLGICGEHGGDAASIDFCHRAGLDYVSCSPGRVPAARLAAAQAALRAAQASR